MTPFNFFLLILASLGTAYLLTNAAFTGPFHLLTKLRERFPLGGLTTCIVCALPYVTALWLFVLLVVPEVVEVLWLAAAVGGALVLRHYTGIGLHD